MLMIMKEYDGVEWNVVVKDQEEWSDAPLLSTNTNTQALLL